MERITLTKRYSFSAAHRLYVKEFSEEENYRIFQKCANRNGHGHNYDVEITVAGDIDNETGRIIDTSLLDKRVNNEIEALDHVRLDNDIDYFTKNQSTGENIAMYLYDRLTNSGELNVIKIKIWENSSSYFEHFKEEEHNEFS